MSRSLAPQRLTGTPSRGRRSGAVLIAVLVCLSIATAIATLTVRQSLDARRQGRVERQVRQTQYLLDAGIRRAIERLRADDRYAGETWEPTAALTRFGGVRVEIRITPVAADDAADDAADEDPVGVDQAAVAVERRVEITARLGPGPTTAYPTQLSFRFPYSNRNEPDTLTVPE